MLAFGILQQIDLKDILCEMQRMRMICLVHQYCSRIVIDRDIRRPPKCKLNAYGSAATAGKHVYD